jgi:crotonobetainyl-CoA:carnitine CoA-transferase CaiB-like acyl-CoA transferase
MLESFRVLDLADEKGYLCGRILGDLGADVIKIEPPGGDPSRNIGPFYKDIPHPEKSLCWFAFSANKRGITLNLETTDGREIFKRLLEKADCILESFPPGYLNGRGLGYSELRKVNPRLIMTSITPFGQNGPYRDFKSSDLVGMAMGGFVYLTGDPERPPVRISFPQAYLHAGADAAAATMIAYYYRELNGEGQHIDVSIQLSVSVNLTQAVPLKELYNSISKRGGVYRPGIFSGDRTHLVWPCKDGFVNFGIYGGTLGAKRNLALVEWMDEEGLADDFLKETDWNNLDLSQISKSEIQGFEERIGKFFLTHTKTELYDGAIKRGIILYPVNTIGDLLKDPQLQHRGFWKEVEHPELRENLTYPGSFVWSSEISPSIRCRAPLIGEHNLEIYEGELGLSRKEILILKEAGVI